MVASPALVPSPNAQMSASMGGSMRSVGKSDEIMAFQMLIFYYMN